ncbi:MAG: helix-turn-helix transcriptional regulator [Clostridia bacterium]|nr:helix-turn-helix transcriptional regulator [Clostridia bacterium]
MEDSQNRDKAEVLRAIGKNIKQARLLRGMTQQMLAETTGLSTNFISLIERGDSGASLTTITLICNALKVDVSVIFKGLITADTPTDNTELMKSVALLENDDRQIVSALVDYIFNSKSDN